MDKEELIQVLRNIKLNSDGDEEMDHLMADKFLLEYINDRTVSDAFDDIDKWYA